MEGAPWRRRAAALRGRGPLARAGCGGEATLSAGKGDGGGARPGAASEAAGVAAGTGSLGCKGASASGGREWGDQLVA